MSGKQRGSANKSPAPPELRTAPEPSNATPLALDAVQSRRGKTEKRGPRFEVTYEGEVANLTAVDDKSHDLLLELFATSDTALLAGVLGQVSNVARTGKELKAQDLNFVLATVRAIEPRDPTEALLALQMASIHNATMVAARRLIHTETIPQQDSASNMLNKLARTFAVQIETLKRYRTNGEQKVTVQHVNVSANQAVVGINQGGGGTHENASQSHAPSVSSQSGAPMLGEEQTQPMSMSSAGGEGPFRVPDARSQGGSPIWEGQRRLASRDGD